MNTIHAPVRVGARPGESLQKERRADTAGRLVVVVPDVADAAILASRIRQVALARGMQVLIIGVASNMALRL